MTPRLPTGFGAHPGASAGDRTRTDLPGGRNYMASITGTRLRRLVLTAAVAGGLGAGVAGGARPRTVRRQRPPRRRRRLTRRHRRLRRRRHPIRKRLRSRRRTSARTCNTVISRRPGHHAGRRDGQPPGDHPELSPPRSPPPALVPPRSASPPSASPRLAPPGPAQPRLAPPRAQVRSGQVRSGQPVSPSPRPARRAAGSFQDRGSLLESRPMIMVAGGRSATYRAPDELCGGLLHALDDRRLDVPRLI